MVLLGAIWRRRLRSVPGRHRRTERGMGLSTVATRVWGSMGVLGANGG